MKTVTLSKKNHTSIKLPKNQAIALRCNWSELDASQAIAALKNIADTCIVRDISFTIYDVPPCLMVSYIPYIKTKGSICIKTKKCKVCSRVLQCNGAPKAFLATYEDAPLAPLGLEGRLTDLEKCMLKVLSTQNNISTEKVLQISQRFRICAGCNDGNHVLSVGERLIRKGLVAKKLKGETFIWSRI